MVNSILVFAATFGGWVWTTVFALAAFIPPFNRPISAFGLCVLALLLLPPLWQYTWRLSKKIHIWGRVGAGVLALVLLSGPTPTSIATPSIAPTPTATIAATAPVAPPPIETPVAAIEPAPEPVDPIATLEPELAIAAPTTGTPIRAAVSGSCDCPYDTDRRGRACGGRSAYSRPGGRQPLCYVGDRW